MFEMRKIIANSIEMKTYEPKDTAAWDEAYEKYLKVTKQ
jgi:rhamnulokinase